MIPPHRAYFDRHVGRWRGVFGFELTDAGALERAQLGWMDRMRVASLARGARLATVWMDTGVSCEGDSVIHTTRVSQLGLPLLWGFERITLGDDGRSFALAAEHRQLPAPWRIRRFDGAGEVDETATRARYELPFFGVPLIQTTVAGDDTLALVQVTAFSRAEVLLRRVL